MRFRQPSHRQASHRAECRFCVRPDLGLIAPAADGLLSTKSCTTLGELAKPLTPPDKPDRLARGQHRLGHSLCAPPRAWPRSAFIPPGPIPRPPVRFGIFEAGLRGPRELVWNDEGHALGTGSHAEECPERAQHVPVHWIEPISPTREEPHPGSWDLIRDPKISTKGIYKRLQLTRRRVACHQSEWQPHRESDQGWRARLV